MPQLFNFVIDGAVLLNVGIGGGNVSFGLVVVIVADKVFYSISGEEFLKFTA